jgi:hypothetical protein
MAAAGFRARLFCGEARYAAAGAPIAILRINRRYAERSAPVFRFRFHVSGSEEEALL